jgi:oligoribonuclease (3'-5' exoribonuclease)
MLPVLQMTGLDVETCHLLEVACTITDDQLNIVAEVNNVKLDFNLRKSVI